MAQRKQHPRDRQDAARPYDQRSAASNGQFRHARARTMCSSVLQDSANVPDPLSFPIEGDVRRLGVTAEGVPDLTASGAESFFAFDQFDLGFDQFWMNGPFDGST